jgi:hypothetical protein
VVNYFVLREEGFRQVLGVSRTQIRLYVSAGTAEDIGHFGSSGREVVRINFELIL